MKLTEAPIAVVASSLTRNGNPKAYVGKEGTGKAIKVASVPDAINLVELMALYDPQGSHDGKYYIDVETGVTEVTYDFSKGVRGKYARRRRKMQDNKYYFVSREDDVDYLRILRETPQNTQFVLVEEKTRGQKPKKWTLFAHLSVLHDKDLQGKHLIETKISPAWGITSLLISDFPYRYVYGSGRFPGVFKPQIEKLRNNRNTSPKDTRTEVTYL